MSTTFDTLQKLMQGWLQNDRFLWVTTPIGAHALLAESLHGWEAVDHGGYHFRVKALSDNPALSLERRQQGL